MMCDTTGAPNEWEDAIVLAKRVVQRRRVALEQLSTDDNITVVAKAEPSPKRCEIIEQLLEEQAELWRRLAKQ